MATADDIFDSEMLLASVTGQHVSERLGAMPRIEVRQGAVATEEPRPPVPPPVLRRVDSQMAVAMWYRAMVRPARKVFMGFAVLVGAKRVNSEGLQWQQACRLAGAAGGRIVIWTRDDCGNVGSET